MSVEPFPSGLRSIQISPDGVRYRLLLLCQGKIPLHARPLPVLSMAMHNHAFRYNHIACVCERYNIFLPFSQVERNVTNPDTEAKERFMFVFLRCLLLFAYEFLPFKDINQEQSCFQHDGIAFKIQIFLQ